VSVRRTSTAVDQLAAYLILEHPDRPAPDPAELRAYLAEATAAATCCRRATP